MFPCQVRDSNMGEKKEGTRDRAICCRKCHCRHGFLWASQSGVAGMVSLPFPCASSSLNPASTESKCPSWEPWGRFKDGIGGLARRLLSGEAQGRLM